MKTYFDDYQGWLAFLNGREEKRVCHETVATHYPGLGIICIYYHSTLVVSISRDEYKIYNNGWATHTTKRRINQFTPPPFKIFQKDWIWFMKDSRGDIKLFEDGTTIDYLGRFK